VTASHSLCPCMSRANRIRRGVSDIELQKGPSLGRHEPCCKSQVIVGLCGGGVVQGSEGADEPRQ
jgi:hypothetical protein